MGKKEKIIEWSEIKAKVQASIGNLTSLNKILKIESVVDKVKTKTLTDEPSIAKSAFLKELRSYVEEGQPIGNYRLYKLILEELLLAVDAKYIEEKLWMTESDYREFIIKIQTELNEVMAKTNEERYEQALELLSDEEKFEELKTLQLEAHKQMEVLALEAAVEDKKLLQSNKVDLLALLQKEKENQ